MRKITAILLLGICAIAYGGVRLNPTSPTDGFIRVNAGDSILLLPIDESAPECRMQIIENGTILRTVILRLAAPDHTDYLLPLDVSNLDHRSLILAVHATNLNQIDWNHMSWTNQYDASVVCGQRPLFHHAPPYGWMNDPNGMFYDASTGWWHLYYQWNPYCATWQNMTWGHAISSDLLHWKPCPAALVPNTLGTIFSGSAVIDHANTAGFGKEAVIAIYTQAELLGQIQSIATSSDHGMTFTPYPLNPVLSGPWQDFRDPKVFWDNQRQAWTMVLVAGQEAQFYTSPDMKQWSLLSTFGSGYGCHEGVWECPDLFPLPVRGTNEQKWVLLININPGGPFGGSATQYFVGSWDGKQFTCDQTDTRWLDMGKDHYAAVTFADAPNNRRTLIAWMSNWQYANQVPTIGFRSANTLPRELDLFVDDAHTYRVGVRPAAEVEQLRGKTTKHLPATAIMDIEVPTAHRLAVITLSNDLNEYVQMTLNPQERTFSMDRSHSGNVDFHPDFSALTTTGLYADQKSYRLTVYMDYNSLEVFDQEGRWSMTNLVFPSKPYNNIQTTNCKSKIYSITY